MRVMPEEALAVPKQVPDDHDIQHKDHQHRRFVARMRLI
jgi:hypothetical protein